MTDKQSLEKLLKKFGVTYESTNYKHEVIITAHEHEKVSGYLGFSTSFLFDEYDTFLSIEIYE